MAPLVRAMRAEHEEVEQGDGLANGRLPCVQPVGDEDDASTDPVNGTDHDPETGTESTLAVRRFLRDRGSGGACPTVAPPERQAPRDVLRHR